MPLGSLSLDRNLPVRPPSQRFALAYWSLPPAGGRNEECGVTHVTDNAVQVHNSGEEWPMSGIRKRLMLAGGWPSP